MKEHPILFSGPMVRAILDGRKTQTRRVVKPQPPAVSPHCGRITTSDLQLDWMYHALPPEKQKYGFWIEDQPYECRFGGPKDRLWVRETWAYTTDYDGQYLLDNRTALYRADNETSISPAKWRPSIHMPRWASRLTLGIVDVRAERLNAINEAGAKAEGVESVSIADVPRNAVWSAQQDFAQLWNTIYGPGSWDENPWVWVVKFKRKEK
jgi:hypothetical protein